MATAHIPRQQPPEGARSTPRHAVEPDVPRFEQFDSAWTWERLVALGSLSVLAHILFALGVVALVVALPRNSPIVLTAKEFIADHGVYVNLAPDQQKIVERPQTNVISDKDRVKATRVPRPDRKTLNQLADNLRPGPPAPPAGGAQSMPAPPAPPPQGQAAPGGGFPQPAGDASAALHAPNSGAGKPSIFSTPSTAGSSIAEAARAASSQRGGTVVGGEYGSGPGVAFTKHRDQFEILTDTLGVDFAPYMKRMKIQVQNNWYNIMPESAMPPWSKKGVVVIEFSILKDGRVTGVRLISSSGDVALDRAAYGAITASNILPALPADFRADYVTVRASFYYNPDRNQMR